MVRLEPVPAGAAHAWAAHANRVLERLLQRPGAAPFRIAPETIADMRAVIARLCRSVDREAALAGGGPRTEVSATLALDPGVLRDFMTYWFNITQLTEAQRATLNIECGDRAGRPFGMALAAALGRAMAGHPSLAEFATRLARQWEHCQPAFAAAASAAAGVAVPAHA